MDNTKHACWIGIMPYLFGLVVLHCSIELRVDGARMKMFAVF